MAGIEKLPTSMPPSPSFDETYACYCALVGVDIDIGSFVLFEDKQGQTSDNGPASCHAVGRLLKLRVGDELGKNKTNAMVRLYPRFQNCESIRTKRNLNVDSATQHIPEVVESDVTELIDPSSILSLCFVYTAKSLNEELFACQGMSNLFLIRYDTAGGDVCNFKSFASEYDLFKKAICTTCRIWKDLQRVQGTMRRILSSTRQAQGTYTRKSIKVHVSPECWRYILHVSKNIKNIDCPVVKTLDVHVMLFSVGTGLEARSTSLKIGAEKVCWESDSDMSILVELFGEGCLFGIRKKRPKVSNSPAYLYTHDEINYVAGCANRADILPDRRRKIRTGIDMTYSSYDNSLRVTIRYQKYVFDPSKPERYPSKRFKFLVDRGPPFNPDAPPFLDDDAAEDEERKEDSTMILEIGDQFMVHDQEVVSIVSVLECGDVVVVFENGFKETIGGLEARALVAAYIEE